MPHHEAWYECAAAGARLCTATELLLNVARMAGCRIQKLNGKTGPPMIWTSTECDAAGEPGFMVSAARKLWSLGDYPQTCEAASSRRARTVCCADYTDGDPVDTSLHSHAYCAGYLTGSVVSEDGKDCVCPDGKIEEAGECVDAPQITLDNR